MSLYRLIGRFLRRHSFAYAVSAAMLVGIALLLVWIPRQIGSVVDGLVAQRLSGVSLLRELVLLVLAGTVVYFLRVGWRLKLYAVWQAVINEGIAFEHVIQLLAREKQQP